MNMLRKANWWPNQPHYPLLDDDDWSRILGDQSLEPLFSKLDGNLFDFVTVPERGHYKDARLKESPFKWTIQEQDKGWRKNKRRKMSRRAHRRMNAEVDELVSLLGGVDLCDAIGVSQLSITPKAQLGTIGEYALMYGSESPKEPHGGVVEKTIQKAVWRRFKTGQFNREIVDKVELFALSFYALSKSVDVPHFIATLLLVIRNLVGESLSTRIYDIALQLLELKGHVPQAGEDGPSWLTALKQCADNWQLAITNPSFKKISALLTMGITLGICDPVSITLGKMELFTAEASKEQVKATSLVDACFQTVIFLTESGLAAWEQKSFMPFLFTDKSAQRLDERYAEVNALFEYATPGNLDTLGMTQGDFEKKLHDVLKDLALARDTLQGGMEKRVLGDKYVRLKAKQASYMQTRASGTMRIRPYSFFITGGSSLGKTDVATIMTQACGGFNGIDVDPDKCYTYNSEDSYLSGYKSYMSVFRFDDFANTRATHVGIAPTSMIVKVINNNVEIAVMPDLESKGTVRIEPQFCTVTSNVMDLDAGTYSNCPASILSRGNVHIVPKVKKRFRKKGSTGLDSRKANDFYRNKATGVVEQPAIPDLWDVTVYTAKINPMKDKIAKDGRYLQGKQQVTFEVLHDAQGPMEDVPLTRVVDFCMQDSKDHFANQAALLERAKGKHMTFCERCKKPTQLCKCAPEDKEPHAGFLGVELTPAGRVMTCMSLSAWRKRRAKDAVKERWSGVFDRSSNWFGKFLMNTVNLYSSQALSYCTYLEYIVEEATSEAVVKIAKDVSNSQWGKWTTYLPQHWFDNETVRSFIVNSRVATMHGELVDVLGENFYGTSALRWYVFLGILAFHFNAKYTAGALLATTSIFNIFMYVAKLFFVRSVAEDRLVEEHENCPELFKNVRDIWGHKIVGGIAAMTTLYGMYKLYKSLEVKRQTPQGLLEPRTVADIKDRDAEENVWKKVEHEKVVVDTQFSDPSHAEERVKAHTCYITLDKVYSCGQILQSNVVMIPYHVVTQARKRASSNTVLLTCVRRETTHVNSTFKKLVDLDSVVRVGEHDLALVNVDTTGSVKGVLDLYPQELPSQLDTAKYIGRDKEGALIEDLVIECMFRKTDNGVKDAGLFSNTLRKFDGLHYKFTGMESKVGLCLGTVLADKKMPYIAGVHLGGEVGNGSVGVAATPLHGELLEAVKLLQNDITHFPAAAASDTFESYGKQHLKAGETHDKSPLNFLEKGNFMSYGPCPGGSTFMSAVQPSLLTGLVKTHFGVENKWGPPKGKGPTGRETWHPWQASLAHSANPSIGVPEHLLRAAMKDYLRPIMKELQQNKEFYEKEFKPLTEIEIVSGRDGQRFIDAMNMQSSLGFPLGGPKTKDLIYLAPNGEHICPRTLTPVHWKEFRKWKKLARQGKRGMLVFKASLKDEPTPITKTKVRVFQAAGMTLQLGMREQFMPCARFMSMHPIMSECAVGVNAHGPEMHQLFETIRKFGPRRGYAGDYSKYDLRMPAQLIYAAFQILIEMNSVFDAFTEEDRKYMEVLASEVACPMTAYNGDLIQLIGSNPSGQNLTAYINSIVNSLLHRCALFDKFGTTLDFRSNVSIMTYGDDFAGSVRKWLNYGNLDFADFCARHDMVVTSPDKETELTQYMDCDGIDFLKRKPRFDKELGVFMGAISEDSIFKSLHCNLKSKTETKESVAAATCASALSEWFLHGREVYDDRVEKLRRVAEEANISKRVHGLYKTYDQRKEEWLKKYSHDLALVASRR